MKVNKKNKIKSTLKFNNKKSKVYTKPKVKELGGPDGPEPTRYGDWEVKGRVSDF